MNIHKLGEKQNIKINNLKQENDKLSKIQEKTTIANFRKNFQISNDLEIIVKKDNKVQVDTDYIGTGAKIEIREKESKKILQEYVCLIYGDVSGDGKISAIDYTLIKNDIMGVKKITDPKQKLVANVYEDNKISALDYTLIKNHIINVKKIELR